jgi:hypothetical protein
MKMNHLLKISTIAILLLNIFQYAAAQNENLKNQTDKRTQSSSKNNTTNSSSGKPVSPPSVASASTSETRLIFPVAPEITRALMLKYAPSYFVIKNLSVRDLPVSSIVAQLKEYRKINWKTLSEELEKDKSIYPDLFVYYGVNEKGKYADLPWKGNQTAPWEGQNTDAGTVNVYLRAIYEFKAGIIDQDSKLTEIVQLAIHLAEHAMPKDKIDKAIAAQQWLEIVRSFSPKNPGLNDLEKEVNLLLNEALGSIEHLLTGEFHKTNLKKIIGFNAPVEPGKENPDNVITSFEAGTPVYLIGYFQTDMKSTGGLPTLKMIHFDEEYKAGVAKGLAENLEKEYLQPMYVAPDTRADIEKQGHFTYALFPDVNSLNYDSHLEYIPHLNFAKWVLSLQPGEYDLDFIFGIRNEMARSPFKMIVNAQSKPKIEAYYSALYEKKVNSVTFPLPGCQNKALAISNAGELAKFGTVLKLDYDQTEDLKFPWPRDNEIQFNTASGYGVFEKNGKVEIIRLEFRKSPSEEQFSFHSIGPKPTDLHMQCPDQFFIKPEILNYGYEMRKENIFRCKVW